MRETEGLLITTLLAAVVIAQPAVAQDVRAGHNLAERWCSACHEIGKAPVQNVVSPPFAAIARMPSTTAISLNAFLSTPHHRMPDYTLTQREIGDVSAYILSLRGSPE